MLSRRIFTQISTRSVSNHWKNRSNSLNFTRFLSSFEKADENTPSSSVLVDTNGFPLLGKDGNAIGSTIKGKKTIRRGRMKTIEIDRTGLTRPELAYLDELSEASLSSNDKSSENSFSGVKLALDSIQGKEKPSPLSYELASMISLRGAITLNEYMTLALNHGVYGYYHSRRQKIGSLPNTTDFVTSPELGSLFGEMLALWSLQTWNSMGSPENFALVECGPGRGSLMSDILRVAERFPEFSKAIKNVYLVEMSPDLRRRQLEALGGSLPVERVEAVDAAAKQVEAILAAEKAGNATMKTSEEASTEAAKLASELIPDDMKFDLPNNRQVTWHSALAGVPQGVPSIYICQEFLDAFPVHQFVYTDRGWREKLVDVCQDGEASTHHFKFVMAPNPTPASKSLLASENTLSSRNLRVQRVLPDGKVEVAPPILDSSISQRAATKERRAEIQALKDAVQEGDGMEMCPLALGLCEDIANRIMRYGGASIMIDYGEDFTQQDSLRAFKQHQQVSVLSEPGLVDVTADVDFSQCRRVAESVGVSVLPLQTQSNFLIRQGILERTEQLINADHVSEEDANTLFQYVKTLIAPDQMGQRFKVLIMTPPAIAEKVAEFSVMSTHNA